MHNDRITDYFNPPSEWIKFGTKMSHCDRYKHEQLKPLDRMWSPSTDAINTHHSSTWAWRSSYMVPQLIPIWTESIRDA